MARTGRPKKEIDKSQFEYLCTIHCTQKEIAGFFKCCIDTVNNWCKRNYKDEKGKKMTFSDVYEKLSLVGNISLRRNQWRMAETNVSMAIWLGKQYLGQKDEQSLDVTTDKVPQITVNIPKANEKKEG